MRLRRPILAALALLAAAPAAAQPSQAVLRPILEQLLPIVDDRENFPDAATLGRFVELTRRELNTDGRAEYFVRGTGPFCGASGNCREWVFTRTAAGAYRLLLDASGKELATQRTSTRGWRDLAQDAHFSAYETVRDVYQFDGTRYAATLSELRVSEGGADRVGFRVRTPLGLPRQVVLEPVAAGASEVRLSATYAACTRPTPGRLCGTPRLVLAGARDVGAGQDRCVTLELELTDGTVHTARARCTVRAGGGADVALTLDPADWRPVAQAMNIRVRASGVEAELPDGSKMGLSTFADRVLVMNGIDPWPDDES